jgi:hypothetical protein
MNKKKGVNSSSSLFPTTSGMRDGRKISVRNGFKMLSVRIIPRNRRISRQEILFFLKKTKSNRSVGENKNKNKTTEN